MQICLNRLGCSGFGRAELDFGQSLATCSATKEQACCQDSADVPVELLLSFPSLKKGREWWTSLFRRGTLALGRAELLLFCLELEEPLPDLLSDLLESDLCSDLFPEDPEAQVLRESSPFRSQYHAINSWMIFRVQQGVQLFMVDHIIFDTFGESVVRL